MRLSKLERAVLEALKAEPGLSWDTLGNRLRPKFLPERTETQGRLFEFVPLGREPVGDRLRFIIGLVGTNLISVGWLVIDAGHLFIRRAGVTALTLDGVDVTL